jgi:hypothetical protein
VVSVDRERDRRRERDEVCDIDVDVGRDLARVDLSPVLRARRLEERERSVVGVAVEREQCRQGEPAALTDDVVEPEPARDEGKLRGLRDGARQSFRLPGQRAAQQSLPRAGRRPNAAVSADRRERGPGGRVSSRSCHVAVVGTPPLWGILVSC